jgi:hypothetical protein
MIQTSRGKRQIHLYKPKFLYCRWEICSKLNKALQGNLMTINQF